MGAYILYVRIHCSELPLLVFDVYFLREMRSIFDVIHSLLFNAFHMQIPNVHGVQANTYLKRLDRISVLHTLWPGSMYAMKLAYIAEFCYIYLIMHCDNVYC